MPGRTVHLVSSIALVLLAQGAARAAPLQWEGTFSCQFLAGLPSFEAESGGVASVNGSSGGLPAQLATLRLAASRQRLNLEEVRLITDPDVITPGASVGLGITATPGTGTLSLGARAMPVRGFLGLWSLPGSTWVKMHDSPLTWLTLNGATAGVGVGGCYHSRSTHTSVTYITSLIHTPGSSTTPWQHTTTAYSIRQLSIQGAPWTIKTATASGFYPPFFSQTAAVSPVTATRRGFVHGPGSGTTSTAQIGGMLQMVTPMQVRWDTWYGYPGASWLHHRYVYGGFGVLRIRFIPEPGVGLLLATGIAGLVAIGRQRIRK